ncbi:MAG: hypothetical protein WC044_04025 [Crocinitomicaceae bacterium]
MSKIILVCALFVNLFAFGQADTIRIVKNERLLFKCVTQNALSWYICIQNNESMLADLKINPNAISEWFYKFADSQNLFKAEKLTRSTKFLVFTKANDPESRISFEVSYFDKQKIILRTNNEVFQFDLIEM